VNREYSVTPEATSWVRNLLPKGFNGYSRTLMQRRVDSWASIGGKVENAIL